MIKEFGEQHNSQQKEMLERLEDILNNLPTFASNHSIYQIHN